MNVMSTHSSLDFTSQGTAMVPKPLDLGITTSDDEADKTPRPDRALSYEQTSTAGKSHMTTESTDSEQTIVPENIPVLKPSIKVVHSEDDFYHCKGDCHVIEILKSNAAAFKNRKRRYIASSSAHVVDASSTQDMLPTRVRVRCPTLLELLGRATNTKLLSAPSIQKTGLSDRAPSFVFLYPFKLFVRHEKHIMDYAKRALDEHTIGGQNTPLPLNADNTDPHSSQFPSATICDLMKLLKELFEEHLASILRIRHDLRRNSRATILFDHLWLLFDAGDIVFQKPSERKSDGIPRLWKVLSYGGGRPILNDNEPSSQVDPLILKEDVRKKNCKDRENAFYIRGLWLESTGKDVSKSEDVYTIPAWEGERPVRELKVFPWGYCEPENDFPDVDRQAWKDRLYKEGQRYSQFQQGSVMFLDGTGLDMNRNTWKYHSEVIIDLEQADLEAPLLSRGPEGAALGSKHPGRLLLLKSLGTSRSVYVFPGDDREVKEFPARTAYENGPILDTIHNDIAFEHDYFQAKIKDDIPPLSSFKSSEEAKSISPETFALFPRTMTGFVLSARKWILFEHRFLTETSHNNLLWGELQLPKGYKRAILAAVYGHRSRGKAAPNLDVSRGKGTGCIILLQGVPGVGKTFTAQALASKLKRPLYSITASDLGDSIGSVDERLTTVLNHGQRWGCVMLLDEADVYLRTRAQNSLSFNSIVGVFLRQLEWFPGIMVLTTNVAGLDEAIVDRCQLRLELPPLNRKAIGKLWQTYCSEHHLQEFISESVAKKLKVQVDPEVEKWWKVHYQEAAEQARSTGGKTAVSGREIQHLLRTAAGLAIHDAMHMKRKRAKKAMKNTRKGKETYRAELEMKKASKLQRGDKISIDVQHLKDAYSLWFKFRRDRDSDGEFALHVEVDEDLEYESQDDSTYDDMSSDESTQGGSLSDSDSNT